MSHILIVDDDESVRVALSHYLQYMGYSCDEAENGARALEWVLGHEVDLVITDNQMPVMSGLEFLECLPKASLFNPPQVIFSTGNLSEKLEKKARQAGARAVLVKPFDTNELCMLVKEALSIPRMEKHCA